LPAGQIDRLEARADLLHGLVAGHRAERVDEGLLVDELPQPVGAVLGQRVADRDRSAQALHFLRRIGALDAVETALRCRGDEVVKISHGSLRWSRNMSGAAFARPPGHDTSFTLRCSRNERKGYKVQKIRVILS